MKKELKEGFVFYLDQIRENVTSLGKWLLLAVLTGCVVGGASTDQLPSGKRLGIFPASGGRPDHCLPVSDLLEE